MSTDEAEVHHIVHRAHWEHVGLPGSMHALDNLITLCGPCHNGGPGSVHSYFNSRIAHGAPLESETFVAAVDDARAHAARVAETGHSDRDGRIAWMYEMGLSTRAIGKQIGVSYPTVLRRLHAMGIQVRDRNANSTPPRRDVERPAWLTDDILGQWSMEAICKKAGCSRGPVQRWRRESGVTGQIGGSPMRCKRHEVSAVPD